jgi:hypothetical protein
MHVGDRVRLTARGRREGPSVPQPGRVTALMKSDARVVWVCWGRQKQEKLCGVEFLEVVP